MINLEYEAARNKLIPQAENYANERVGKRLAFMESREHWALKWTVTFLEKMDELAWEQGLIK